MRLGLHLANQHPPGDDLVRRLDEQLGLLAAARDLGWHSVWVAHHHLPDSVAMLQPIPYLARLTAHSGQMRVGLGIHLLALANPVAAAEEVATLDVLSGGRLIYGAGLGYREREYAALGVAGSPRERFEANLDVVCRLLEGETVDIDLPWSRAEGARLAAPPVQRPRPPLWLAANRDAGVRRAARLADTWVINPHATQETVARQLDVFRQERADAGLPPATDVPLIREVICAETSAEAETLAAAHLGRKYQQYARWGQDRVMPTRESFERPFADLAAERFVIGDPDACLRQLRGWRRLGVTDLIVRAHWSGMPVEAARRTVELLTAEVWPGLTDGTEGEDGAT